MNASQPMNPMAEITTTNTTTTTTTTLCSPDGWHSLKVGWKSIVFLSQFWWLHYQTAQIRTYIFKSFPKPTPPKFHNWEMTSPSGPSLNPQSIVQLFQSSTAVVITNQMSVVIH